MQAAAAAGGARASSAGDAPRELPFADLVWEREDDGERLELGRGAFGTVYAATLGGAPVAVKLVKLPPGTGAPLPAVLAGFWEEVRLQASLRCEWVVSVLGGAVDRRPSGEPRGLALVMERETGGTLEAWTSSDAGAAAGAPVAGRLHLLLDLARGLRFLHAADVVHGDLKPANVLLSPCAGEEDRRGGTAVRAKLTDFGLSRVRRDGETTRSTLRPGGGGSPVYMAPERLAAGASLRKPADVYAWGIVAWELLCRRRAFEGLGLSQLAAAVGGGERPDVGALPGEVAGWAAPLLTRCFAGEAPARPSAGELCVALEAALGIGGGGGGGGAASGPGPVALCVVCLAEEPLAEGVTCEAGHYCCRECLQGVAQMDAGPEQVTELLGAVRCPWRGQVGAGTATKCASPPWTLEDVGFASALAKDTTVALAAAAQRALGRLRRAAAGGSSGGGGSGGAGAMPAAPAPPPAAQPTAAGGAPTLDDIARAAQEILAAHPLTPGEGGVLACPGCAFPFVDYSGCAALRCGSEGAPGCGTRFCALCLATFPDAGSCHAHFLEPPRGQAAHHGVGEGYSVSVAEFEAYHKRRRGEALRAAVRGRWHGDEAATAALWRAVGGSGDIDASREAAVLDVAGVVAVLADASASAGACQHALFALVGMARAEAACEAAVAAMRRHAGSSGVSEAGCRALRNMADSYAGRSAVAAAGGVAVIVAALQRHAESEGVSEAGCGALWYIADSEAGQTALLAAGGVAVVVAALQRHVQSEGVSEAGCGALWYIADSDAGRSAVVAAGGMVVIVAALQRHVGSETLSYAGFGALGNISGSDAGRSALVAAGGVAVVVAALQRHVQSEAVIFAGCKALVNITASDAGRSTVLAAGGVAVIVAALQRHVGSAAVSGAGREALRNIAVSDAGRSAVVAAGGGPLLV